MNRLINFHIFPKKFGLMPYIFLVYVFFPISFIAAESGWKRILGFALIFLFVISYRQLYFVAGTRQFHFWLYLQMTIILILTVYNINHIFLGFFPANFISWYRDRRLFRYAIIYLAFCIISPILMSYKLIEDTLIYLIPFIIIILFSPLAYRSMYTKMELEKQLEQANEQINELVKREERLRIARDLHDTLGHTLSLITLKSQLVAKLVNKDGERAINEAREIEKTSRSALTQVRELIDDMRMITISDELIEAKALLEAANISFTISNNEVFDDALILTQNIVSMCIREAVTNVVKHSYASRCDVSIVKQTGALHIAITDDGTGFSLNKSRGNGLKGMEERLHIIDGTMNIKNSNGTCVSITIPLISQVRKKELDDTNYHSRRSADASRSPFFSS